VAALAFFGMPAVELEGHRASAHSKAACTLLQAEFGICHLKHTFCHFGTISLPLLHRNLRCFSTGIVPSLPDLEAYVCERTMWKHTLATGARKVEAHHNYQTRLSDPRHICPLSQCIATPRAITLIRHPLRPTASILDFSGRTNVFWQNYPSDLAKLWVK
jgi:hypothetical protein